MKFLLISKKRGYALLMVMILCAAAVLIAGSTMSRTYTVSKLNQRAKQFQSAMYAAEAACEKVYAKMRYDYLNGGDAALSNGVAAAIYQNMVPNENSLWGNYVFSDGQNNTNRTYVSMVSSKTYQALDGNYAGLNGWRAIYRIVSNAKTVSGLEQVSAGVQQEIAVDTIPAFQFVIFYNNQLEFTWCASLTNRGRVHANGPICLGAAEDATLRFDGTVSSTVGIYASNNLGGYPGSGQSFSTPIYKGDPQKKTGVPTLKLPIGTNDNSAASVRQIINLPQGTDSAALSEQRFFNKAAVVLIVSNTTIDVVVKSLGASIGIVSNFTFNSYSNVAYPTNGTFIAQRTNLYNTLPFLSLTNRFYDYREGKWVMPTQIDMGILKKWLTTNIMVTTKYATSTNTFPNIMYVADFRTVTNLHAVRLTNGIVIPTNAPTTGTNAGVATGFTVATINPLYVWGDYNCPDPTHLGKTNTTKAFPASFVSDAITILSANWQDGATNALSSRNATSTTVNAAIIAGAVYTTTTGTGNFSGGVVNLTRLLENWSGDTLTLNTSLVNLYDSVRATTQFKNPGAYYNAPTRNFNFDQNFLSASKLPPGTPTVSVISRSMWTICPPNTITYNGP